MYSKEGITQGDPLAMAMFALASVPLIRRIDTDGAIQAWYADDASSGGLLACIRKWWDQLTPTGRRDVRIVNVRTCAKAVTYPPAFGWRFWTGAAEHC